MAIRPVDISLSIQNSPQIAAISKASEEAPRVAQSTAQIEYAKGLEQREEQVEQAEHSAAVLPSGRERRDGEGRQPNQRRKGAYDAAKQLVEGEELEETGEHLIDISV